jgi:O-antigen ligase
MAVCHAMILDQMIFFYLLVAILPLSDHHLLGKSFGGITIFKILGAICVGQALVRLASGSKPLPLFDTWQARLSTLFLLSVIISFFIYSGTPITDYSVVLACVSFLSFFIAAVVLVDSLRRLRATLLWTVGSVALASVYIIREWWHFHAIYGAGYRPGGATGDSNYYALSALMGLVIGYYLLLEQHSLWHRTFVLLCTSVTLIGLSLAASRGGLLGMLASFSYLIWRSRNRARNLAVAVLLVVPCITLLPSSPLNRFFKPNEGDRIGQEDRVIVWRAGWKIIKEHPLFGIGAGQFRRQVQSYEGTGEDVQSLAHNTYVEVAAEMGIGSLLLFLSILVFTFLSLERTSRMALRNHAPKLLQVSALSIQASLVGYAVSLCFLTGQYQKHLWFMIFLSIVLQHLAVDWCKRKRRDAHIRPICTSSGHTAVLSSTATPKSNVRGLISPVLSDT